MRKFGVLVISHGSRSEEWVRLVDEAVAGVRLPVALPVVSSFLEIVEGRLIQDGIRVLEADGVTDIIAVPLFVSSGSTHIDEISYALGVIPEPNLPTDMEPFELKAAVHFTSPIDDEPEIARIVYEKIRELSVDPSGEIVLLIGHGSIEKGFHTRWKQGLERLSERIRELGGFDGADVAMLLPNQIPWKMKLLRKRKPGHRVIVAPLFLSEGYFTKQVIPSRMEGYEYLYNGQAMLPDPLIARWMEQRIVPVLEKHGLVTM